MKYELSHDTIARQIAEKANATTKARRRVEAYLKQDLDLYRTTRRKSSLLTADKLEEIRPFVADIRLSEEEENFIELSEKYLSQKTWRQRITTIAIIAVLALAAVYSYYKKLEANEQAHKANAARFSVMAQQDLSRKNFTDALANAYEALKLEPTNAVANQVMMAVFHANYEGYAPLRVARFRLPNSVDYGTIAPNNRCFLTKMAVSDSTSTVQLWRFPAPTEGSLSTEKGVILVAQFDNCDSQFEPHFSPQSDRFLILKNEKELLLVDTSGKIKTQMNGHSDYITKAEFSPDSQRIITCSFDNNIFEWTKDGIFTKNLRHTEGSSHFKTTFSKDGQQFASSGENEETDSVEIFDFKLDTVVEKYPSNNSVGLFQFNNLGKIWRWSSGNQSKEPEFANQSDGFHVLFFRNKDNNGNYHINLEAVSDAGQALLQLAPPFSVRTGHLSTARYSKRLLLNTGDDCVKIMSFDGKIEALLPHPDASDAIFSDDAKMVLSYSADGLVTVFSSQELVSLDKGYQQRFTSICSPDGSRLLMFDISKKMDKSPKVGPAKLLKLTDNGLNCTELFFKKTATNPNSTRDTLAIRLAEFSPQSDLLAVVSLDSMPSLFDKEGVLTTVFPTDAAAIQGLKWSKDGQFLLFEKEKSVEIWQRNGQKMGDISLPDQLLETRFLIDNQSFVTTCLDSTTIVWSLNGQKKYTLKTKEKYATIDVSPDGKWLIAGTYLTNKVHRFRTDGTGKPTVCFDPSVADKEDDREVTIRGVNFLPDSRRALVWTELGSLFLIATDSLVMPKRPLSTALRNMFVSPNRAKMLLSTNQGFELWATDGNRLYQSEKSVFAQASFTEKADCFALSGFHATIVQRGGTVYFSNDSTLWQSPETIMHLLNQQPYRLHSLEERKQLGLE